jgi:hypothetical protein
MEARHSAEGIGPEELVSSSRPSFSQSSLNEWIEVQEMLLSYPLLDTAYFLLLVNALGGSVIPELTLLRARLPQQRWNDSGMDQQVRALEAGLDQQLLDIVSDTNRLNQILGLLVKLNPPDGCHTFSLESQLQGKISHFLSDEERAQWSMKALVLVCFVFPRDQLWEVQPSYAFIVRRLLPVLNHVLQAVKPRDMDARVKIDAVEALLAASKIGKLHDRQCTLSTAIEILDGQSPPYLRADVALQQSILSRLAGDFGRSERAIHNSTCGCEYPLDTCISGFYRQIRSFEGNKRLNALYGRL